MSTTNAGRRKAAGQTLAIFALMLPVLIGMAGLGADGANVYLNFRNAQGAADLASLAGARTIPLLPTLADYTAAENRAVEVAASNGYSSGVTATAPYVDGGVIKPYHVEVLINTAVPTYLLPLLGRPTWDVNVRAVAGSEWSNSSGSVPAVYAGCGADDDPGNCQDENKAIDWSGSDGNIIGGAVSNCGILVGGSNNEIEGGATYLAGCNFDNSGSGNTYTPSAASDPVFTPWPVDVQYDELCGPSASDVIVRTSNDLDLSSSTYYLPSPAPPRTLRPGVYCVTSSSKWIKVPSSGVSGRVTLVSLGGVEFGGGHFDFTYFHSSKVFVWAGGNQNSPGNPVIKFNGSGSDETDCAVFEGMIVAYSGQIEVSGQHVCSGPGGGSVLGDTVKFNGSNYYINSNGLSGTGVPYLESLKLYE